MSSQPLPNPYTPNTYNPTAWGVNDTGLTKKEADLLYLQFPFAQGLESMVGIVNVGSLTQNGASQFGISSSSAGIPTCVADFSGITPTDATTKIPTTAWVQTAIGASSGGSSIFDTDNTWTNDNTFEAIIHGTAPASTANGTQIPTTEWVNDAITTAIQNITPSTNTTFSNTFNGTATSYSYTVPSDAQYFNFSGCGCGGLAGANAVFNIFTSASSIPIPNDGSTTGGTPDDFQLWAGGQGGGGLGNSISNIPNSSVGLAGQVITFSCSGNGGNTTPNPGNYVQASWTNSITGLPVIIRLPSGYNGSDASSVNPSGSGNGAGGGGAGGIIANAILPPLTGGSWITWTPPNNSAPPGAPGSPSETSFLIYLPPSTTTPYQVLNPPYDPTSNAYGAPWLGGAYPTAPVGGSGTTGYGQYLSSFYTTTDIIYTSTPDIYYGNSAGPIGQGFFTLQCFTESPSALGGTNASFIAYDDPDPATKTKQIYTDKEGLVVAQDLTTTPKTTTLTPTNLTQDISGVVSTALIADIISVANTGGGGDLGTVLTAGNTATNSIALNNTPTGANVISILPNVGATDPQITITDGTTTNTINKNGYTTRNSVQNSTHYLNFSDSSSTGTGSIQKTAGLSCNPSTSTLSATTLTTTNLTVNSPYNFSVVGIYADATARNTGIPTPYAGQLAFLTGSNKLQYWNTNWNNISVILNNPVITGFTLATNYELIYVNASNTVINAPTLGGYTIVRFFPTTTTSGTITLPNTTSVEYLVVAGGGGGGGGAFTVSNGGGGGAGGLLTATDSMVELTSYAVSVGQGGTAGAIAGNGGNGANSSLVVSSGTITATGGGGGGGGVAGLNGGSGGGAGFTGAVLAGGTGTVGQGNDGGSSTTASPYPYSGGGGGAGAVGSSSVGQGGVGLSSTITGATVFYAGGGGGGASAGSPAPGTLPTGGNGGGGNGGYFNNVAPTAGTNGRGGGGGGRGNTTSSTGAAGGSGVVLVRFPSYT